MRLSLLVGLAAALTLVAVARADPGDSTEVEDAVGEREPTTPVRGRRQVEKQQQPRPRPGSLSLLRPAKVEVQESEVRTRREIERRPQPRPGPSPNPPGHSHYNYGHLSALAGSPGEWDNHQQKRVKREGQKPQPARRTRETTGNHGSESILGMIHLEEFITLATPVLDCPSCQGSVATGQDGRSGDPEPQDQERRRKAHGGEAQSQAESERLTLRCWL